MDTFVEQIVVRKKGAKEYAIIFGLLFAAALLILVLSFFVFSAFGFIALLLIMGVGYGTWWLITSQNKEFEYSVTNGDIDIDEIIARRKRKRAVSVAGEKIETLESYSDDAFAARHFDRRVIAAPSTKEDGLWCFSYHSKKNGHTLVVFQPEKRVLDALLVGLPSLLQREVKKQLVEH